MAHTSETQYYGLPIFTGNDILNPLTDLNGAMTDIDTAMHEVAENSGTASSKAEEAKETAEAMEARIVTLESQMTDVEEAQDDITATVADTFDPLKVGGYAIGDIVIYEGKMYQFVNAHSGAWSASDAVEVNVSEILKQTSGMLAGEFDPAKVGGYEAGDYVIYGGKLYKFTRVHTGSWNVSDVDEVTVGEEMKTSAGALANLSGMRVDGAPATFTIASGASLMGIKTQMQNLWTNKPANAVDLVLDYYARDLYGISQKGISVFNLSYVALNGFDNEFAIVTNVDVSGGNDEVHILLERLCGYHDQNVSGNPYKIVEGFMELGGELSIDATLGQYFEAHAANGDTSENASSNMVFTYHYVYEI